MKKLFVVSIVVLFSVSSVSYVMSTKTSLFTRVDLNQAVTDGDPERVRYLLTCMNADAVDERVISIRQHAMKIGIAAMQNSFNSYMQAIKVNKHPEPIVLKLPSLSRLKKKRSRKSLPHRALPQKLIKK